MCQSLTLLGSVPWKALPTRVHAPTSIGGNASGRVAGMASADVGGLASVATAAGGAAGGGATSAGGGGGGGGGAGGAAALSCARATVGAADRASAVTRLVVRDFHRAPTRPCLMLFLSLVNARDTRRPYMH